MYKKKSRTSLYERQIIYFEVIMSQGRGRERRDRGRFLPLGKKKHGRGTYRVPLINLFFCLSVCCLYLCLSQLISLSVCPSVYVCVTFVVFTESDSESCTRPISTYLESMEAGEYGLTRGTCSIARRLEVVAVAGLLWIS